ncbi:MAG TPA: hypothetical protein VNB49_19360 [Candidatus Dormibacteraeota bacterium]|nr:hypothetical protein [Candidatus Dormibacteraeota bacterium]
MDDTKENSYVYSRELIDTAEAEAQAEAKEIAETLAGKAPAAPKTESRYSPVANSPVGAKAESSPAQELMEFLKQSKRVWLMVVGAIVALILLVTLAQRGFEWIGKKRERRHEQAVASVTPEHLLARCGQPSEDTTRNMYPILLRTMTYQVSRNETYVFDFSRTAEDKSDWVFLSMKDDTGKTYETPEEKVAAMSCLDSRK